MSGDRHGQSGKWIVWTLLSVVVAAGQASMAQTTSQSTGQKQAAKVPAKSAAEDVAGPQQTKHYPILVIAHGVDPGWSLRLGMKGPERLDRAGYPPIVLEPSDVASDEAGKSWTYHAKDSATGAAVSVRLVREACAESGATQTFTFRVTVEHAQIGTLNGCGLSSPDQFPEFRRKNQIDPPAEADPNGAKDKDKDKNTVLEPITKFTTPTAFAYLDGGGKVILSRAAAGKMIAPKGYELSLSHDGKKLLYTRDLAGANRTIVLYDAETGRSQDLITGLVHQAFWSPDDSRVAFLKFVGEQWQVWVFPVNAPEKAVVLSPQTVLALHGWASANSVLATDMQAAYWLGEDGKTQQSITLKEIYGDTFQIMSSDTIRISPINSDLLLISAFYLSTPAGAPVDSMGLNASFFLHEIRSKRTVVVGPTDQWARSAEWSRDGLQIYFTRMAAGNTFFTNRIFWDGSGLKRFNSGNSMTIGK